MIPDHLDPHAAGLSPRLPSATVQDLVADVVYLGIAHGIQGYAYFGGPGLVLNEVAVIPLPLLQPRNVRGVIGPASLVDVVMLGDDDVLADEKVPDGFLALASVSGVRTGLAPLWR